MTYDEPQAVAFLDRISALYFMTGSRVICSPPVLNTDVDFVVLDRVELFLELGQPSILEVILHKEGFKLIGDGGSYGVDEELSSSVYEKGRVNIILCKSELTFKKWGGATLVAKKLNLRKKQDRINLFQGVLYGNWDAFIDDGNKPF